MTFFLSSFVGLFPHPFSFCISMGNGAWSWDPFSSYLPPALTGSSVMVLNSTYPLDFQVLIPWASFLSLRLCISLYCDVCCSTHVELLVASLLQCPHLSWQYILLLLRSENRDCSDRALSLSVSWRIRGLYLCSTPRTWPFLCVPGSQQSEQWSVDTFWMDELCLSDPWVFYFNFALIFWFSLLLLLTVYFKKVFCFCDPISKQCSLGSDSWFSHLSFLIAGITGMHHHAG